MIGQISACLPCCVSQVKVTSSPCAIRAGEAVKLIMFGSPAYVGVAFGNGVDVGFGRGVDVGWVLGAVMWTVGVGIAVDVVRRVNEHNVDNRRAARYTRSRRPVTLVYREPRQNRAEAARRECEIKQLSKKAKESLVREYKGECT